MEKFENEDPKVTLIKDLPGIKAPAEGEWIGPDCWFPNADDPFTLSYMRCYPDFFVIEYNTATDGPGDEQVPAQ